MRPLNKAFTSSVVLAAVFAIALAAPAAAAPQRAVGHFGAVARGHVVVRGGLYDPFWGSFHPYWGYPYDWGYPYAGYPYWAYPYEAYPTMSAVRTEVTPKQTEVYVDGYYAGVADDFDGAFKRLHTSPGGHAVTLRLDGYRTVTEDIYVRPDSTYKLIDTMEKLAPGEVSAAVPLPALPSARPDSATPGPDGGSALQR